MCSPGPDWLEEKGPDWPEEEVVRQRPTFAKGLFSLYNNIRNPPKHEHNNDNTKQDYALPFLGFERAHLLYKGGG
jgi:hypothetical protein